MDILLFIISKFYMLMFLTSPYVLVPTPYGRLYLPKKSKSIGRRIITYMTDMVESQWANYFEDTIKQINGEIFVDVGAAADGWYSIKASKLNSRVNVVAVEPSALEYEALLVNLAANGCLKRVLPINAALTDYNGVTILNQEKVKCMRLDTLVHNQRYPLNSLRVIKIDVEGAGLTVLRGATQILQYAKPVIFIEIHNEEEAESQYFLRNYGYETVLLAGDLLVASPKFRRAGF